MGGLIKHFVFKSDSYCIRWQKSLIFSGQNSSKLATVNSLEVGGKCISTGLSAIEMDQWSGGSLLLLL